MDSFTDNYVTADKKDMTDFIQSLVRDGGGLSSEEIASLIRQLMDTRERVHQQEQRKEAVTHSEDSPSENSLIMLPLGDADLSYDMENPFGSVSATVKAESIPDGLVLSLNNLGRVDIEYISAITGEDCLTVISTLKGVIYQNPEKWNDCWYKGWEMADEYLSGDVAGKLIVASEADRIYKGYFRDNIIALQNVSMQEVCDEDISITLGSPWIPTYVIDRFIEHLFGDPLKRWASGTDKAIFATKHDSITGSWELPHKSRYGKSIATTTTYGTWRTNALEILERTLNFKDITIYETDKLTGAKQPNQSETVIVIEKQAKLLDAFQQWIGQTPWIKQTLMSVFRTKFRPIVKRRYDGSFLSFPEMNEKVQLYPYQKDAVARIIFSKNTLLAHEVGCGKTYVMIAAGMEMRRMGISKKNMYVVPNGIVGQWQEMFTYLYPGANVLCVTPAQFTATNRKTTLRRIKEEDFDGIIIAYSCFERIPISNAEYIRKYNRLKEEINESLLIKSQSTKALKKRHEKIIKALASLEGMIRSLDDGLTFDRLGVTRLFVDEAHNYKNVPIESKSGHALGINYTGSRKCADMMDKVQVIQNSNSGGGVIMATGTPLTNSITDMYTFQRYLQPAQLKLTGLESFDSWVSMFARKNPEFEIDVDTSKYRVILRLSRFHNLQQLTNMVALFADFRRKGRDADIPLTNGYRDILIPKTLEFSDYLEYISQRADRVRSRKIGRHGDNMLKITNDGRKAALDLRLVKAEYGNVYMYKIAHCAAKVAEIYRETADRRSTQLVFCDVSTPKNTFNVYDELKRMLIEQGIPGYEIAFIHDAVNEQEREILFRNMRLGMIRVLIGSTFKLGTGVNIQDRLIALHHLDVPWRPADIIQREGRILRQGNLNGQVYIYRYITQGSFDAYSWQLLETKQNFIAQLLSGCVAQTECSDISETALNYGEIKALAVGNPLIKERVEKANQLKRLITLQAKTTEARELLVKEQTELPVLMRNGERLIAYCKMDMAEALPQASYTTEQRMQLRSQIANGLASNIMVKNERKLVEYRGFSIILPAGMTSTKPYIWLTAAGRYRLELGDSETGNLTRIDNFISNLNKQLEKLQDIQQWYADRQTAIETELGSMADYKNEIELYTKQLEKLDIKLGKEMP